jgi:hypothetical protein
MLQMRSVTDGSSASLYQPANLHPAIRGLDSLRRTI